MQCFSITSTEQRVHMHVSSSDHCERTILSTVSIFAKGQINEECLLGNVESWKSLHLGDTSGLLWGKLLCCWCCCVTASRNLVATRNHVAEHWTLAMLEEKTFALVQCLAKAFVKQSRSQQSTVLKKGHHAGERTILSTVSIFAKGQINEECLLRNVESWQSLRLADTSDLVWGRLFGCWCCCVNASRSSVATRNHVTEHWTLAMLEEKTFTFALVQCLASVADW